MAFWPSVVPRAYLMTSQAVFLFLLALATGRWVEPGPAARRPSPAGASDAVDVLDEDGAPRPDARRTEERLELPAGTTLAALREQLAGRGLEMARIIGVSSYLVNALSTPADSLAPLADGDRIDILPPFAGG